MAAADGFLRIVSIGVRKYSREPQTRLQSARLILSGALALYAAEAGAAEVALLSAEIIGTLAVTERREKKAEAVATESGGRS